MKIEKLRPLLAIAILLTFVALSLQGCKREEPEQAPARLNVLTSFLPMYIFTANVVKGVEGVKVDILLPPEGAGPHGYHLTPGDMRKLSEADILVINGLDIEKFIVDSLKETNPDIKVIVASRDIVTIPDLKDVDEEEGHEEHHHGPANPHVWVSPARAAIEVRNIAEGLAAADPEYGSLYMKNAALYATELLRLAAEFKTAASGAKNKKIVTIHNAFDYLAMDSGLEVVAVLRMDPTAEPRPAELSRIVEIIKNAKPAGIFVEPQFSDKLARSLSGETDVPIYTLDPVATGVLRDDYYVEIMHNNLENLKKALAK